jgi:hypothetical protein
LPVQPGSGLHVVSYLTGGDWGVHEGDLGKWVWARVRGRELPDPATHRPRARRVPRGC